MKMWYRDDMNSGVVKGRSHDGGIGSIINEDKQGLDLIYIYRPKDTMVEI